MESEARKEYIHYQTRRGHAVQTTGLVISVDNPWLARRSHCWSELESSAWLKLSIRTHIQLGPWQWQKLAKRFEALFRGKGRNVSTEAKPWLLLSDTVPTLLQQTKLVWLCSENRKNSCLLKGFRSILSGGANSFLNWKFCFEALLPELACPRHGSIWKNDSWKYRRYLEPKPCNTNAKIWSDSSQSLIHIDPTPQ
jgi:hypothetical protein